MSEERKPCEHCPTLIIDEVRNGVELQPFVECSFCAKEFHLPLPPEIEAVLEAAELWAKNAWGYDEVDGLMTALINLGHKRNEKTQ